MLSIHFYDRFWTFLLLSQIVALVQARVSPNIILIVADDLGSADASFNMKIVDPQIPPMIHTPHLDFLADHGIALSSYYTLPLCGPSRAALLTSLLPFRLENPFPTRRGWGDLSVHVDTIASELKIRNYVSHFVGKWGVDDGGQHFDAKIGRWVNVSDVVRKGPLARGFDTFFGLYKSAHNHYTKRILHAIDWHQHNETGWYDYPDVDPEPNDYSTHIFTREATNVIHKHALNRKTKAKPFFIHLSYTAPHDPLQVPKEYEESSTCASIPNWRRKTFCGMVRCLDEGVGNITATLKAYGLLEDTIVVFVSDNGGFWYVGGRNYPYRGFKGGIYEGGVHVPAFIHAPKYLNGGGRVFKGLFHAIDWAPTLLSIIDRNQGRPFTHSLGEIDGKDLSLALSTGTTDPTKLRHSILLASDPFSNGTAYIKGDYKLILGMGGIDVVAWEPDSYWTIDSAHVTWSDKVEETIVNVLDTVSTDLFPFAWSFHIVFASYRDFLRGTAYCTVDHHPEDKAFFRDPNQTFPIALPCLEEDIPDRTSRIQLYNLKKDPFEKNNIARTHKHLVEEMQKEIIQLLQDAPPQMGAIHYMFRNLIFAIRLVQICFLTLVGLTTWRCCGGKRTKNWKNH